jgi:hypothetical protein
MSEGKGQGDQRPKKHAVLHCEISVGTFPPVVFPTESITFGKAFLFRSNTPTMNIA